MPILCPFNAHPPKIQSSSQPKPKHEIHFISTSHNLRSRTSRQRGLLAGAVDVETLGGRGRLVERDVHAGLLSGANAQAGGALRAAAQVATHEIRHLQIKL